MFWIKFVFHLFKIRNEIDRLKKSLNGIIGIQYNFYQWIKYNLGNIGVVVHKV